MWLHGALLPLPAGWPHTALPPHTCRCTGHRQQQPAGARIGCWGEHSLQPAILREHPTAARVHNAGSPVSSTYTHISQAQGVCCFCNATDMRTRLVQSPASHAVQPWQRQQLRQHRPHCHCQRPPGCLQKPQPRSQQLLLHLRPAELAAAPAWRRRLRAPHLQTGCCCARVLSCPTRRHPLLLLPAHRCCPHRPPAAAPTQHAAGAVRCRCSQVQRGPSSCAAPAAS